LDNNEQNTEKLEWKQVLNRFILCMTNLRKLF